MSRFDHGWLGGRCYGWYGFEWSWIRDGAGIFNEMVGVEAFDFL